MAEEENQATSCFFVVDCLGFLLIFGFSWCGWVRVQANGHVCERVLYSKTNIQNVEQIKTKIFKNVDIPATRNSFCNVL